MKQKILKVYESPGSLRNTPRILLQGKWLEHLGYHVGDHIIVIYDHNQISIRLQSSKKSDS